MFERIKSRQKAECEGGFTLIELLVVIIILGILAAVVVFAVGGVGDKGASASCKIDTRTLRTAEEAYAGSTLGNGQYGTEQQLKDGGFLSELSTYHDIGPIVVGTTSPPVQASFKILVQDAKCGVVNGEVGNPATNL